MIRTLNFTGRKRILREDVRIALRRELDGMIVFDAELLLEKAAFPPTSRVFIEAAFKTTFMRFDCGTVAKLAIPADRRLVRLQQPALAHFRVKVVEPATKGPGRLLAVADHITPARYLHEQFKEISEQSPAVIEGKDGLGDAGFWAAVALFYFNVLVPGYRSGKEKPKADNCYIPETGIAWAGVRFYRHRIAGAYRLYKLHGELSRPLLLSPAGEQSSLYTRITDSFFYTETRCGIEAINLLYFDERNRRLRHGWNAKSEPGTLPRLLAVMDQLDLTHDLLGINGEALLALLPDEFDRWRSAA